MLWTLSHRADVRARPLADRHYSRKTIGAAHFTPPGRCLVLLTENADALWVTSWPYAEYVKHDWAGAWLCSLFRNESPVLSSELIIQAVRATKWKWDPPPTLGMITFVDTTKVKRKRDWGRCYRKAGFKEVGKTKGGLIVLQLLPEEMPPQAEPMGVQQRLVF